MKIESTIVHDILCEFLEVAIHNILYLRKIYPQSTYLPAKKYGIVLYQSVHVQLKAYITEILQSTQFYLKCGTLKRVIVCVESQKVTLERYIFNVIELKDQIESDALYLSLEQSFREFFIKLFESATHLSSLPDDPEFRIQLHVTQHSLSKYNDNYVFSKFPWVQVNASVENSEELLPVHLIETDIITLDVFVKKPV